MGNETPGGPAEPFEGFAGADIATIEKEIASRPEGGARESFKVAVREAEFARDGDPRKGVLAATEPEADAPPADPDPAAPPPEEASGRPPLNKVAEQEAANRNERDRDYVDDAREE